MKIINFRPPCTLSLKARLVYSALYEAALEGGASKRRIREFTGVHTSLDTILEELTGLYWINKKPGEKFKRYVAENPPDEIVLRIKGAKDWFDGGLGFFEVHEPLPACPLNRLENIVYWKLVNLNADPKNWSVAKGLADLLGVPGNLSRALKNLKRLGLLQTNRLNHLFAIDAHPEYWGLVPHVEPAVPERAIQSELGEVEPIQAPITVPIDSLKQGIIVEPVKGRIVKLYYDDSQYGPETVEEFNLDGNCWMHEVREVLEGYNKRTPRKVPTDYPSRDELELEIYSQLMTLFVDDRITKHIEPLVMKARSIHAAKGKGNTIAFIFQDLLKKHNKVENHDYKENPNEPEDPFESDIKRWEAANKYRRLY